MHGTLTRHRKGARLSLTRRAPHFGSVWEEDKSREDKLGMMEGSLGEQGVL